MLNDPRDGLRPDHFDMSDARQMALDALRVWQDRMQRQPRDQ
jgi:hypothetical protein